MVQNNSNRNVQMNHLIHFLNVTQAAFTKTCSICIRYQVIKKKQQQKKEPKRSKPLPLPLEY